MLIMTIQEKLQKLQNLESLVTLMDSKFSFLGFSFGLDSLIGLIPGFGDTAGGLISLFIILRIRHIGVSPAVLDKMISNVLIDVLLGSVPLVGDIFDVAFKVNVHNLAMAKKHLQEGYS